VLDADAAVGDDGEACLLRTSRRAVVPDAELHPENPGADGGRGLRHLRDELGAAEDVHDVDRLGEVRQRGAHPLAVQFPTRDRRVHRQHATACPLQVGRHPEARTPGLVARADDGDRPGAVQDPAQVQGRALSGKRDHGTIAP
jgi:hypothetical protein